MCPEWDTFEGFLHDMGIPEIGLSLDRIDNDGPYSKQNCRWATRSIQAQNTRKKTELICAGGKIQSITEWAKELGLTRQAFYKTKRINRDLAQYVEEKLQVPRKKLDLVLVNGKAQSIPDWAKELGLTKQALYKIKWANGNLAFYIESKIRTLNAPTTGKPQTEGTKTADEKTNDFKRWVHSSVGRAADS